MTTISSDDVVGIESEGVGEGASASQTGLSPTVEPASSLAGSAASIPSAALYTTIVLKHTDALAERAFIQFAHANWPFMADEEVPTQMTAVSIGDAMSVQELMRSALECDDLDRSDRIDLALDLDAHCYTWQEGLAYAEKEWELHYRDGKFVDAPVGDE